MIAEGVRLAGAPDRIVDIEVADGRIAHIRPSARTESSRVALPAFVDLHTHLREPGGEEAEDVASGARSAAAGGFADVFAMPNTTPATDTVERVAHLRTLAGGVSARVHPIAAATLGRLGGELVDVEALRAAGVRVFSDDGSCLDDAKLVADLLSYLAKFGGVFAQHAQSSQLAASGVANARVATGLGVAPWPLAAEENVIARDIALAERTGGHLHVCHVSTAGSVAILRAAKRRGAPVTAEVTPHHLALTDDLLTTDSGEFKVNPPLRSQSDVDALRHALRDGTIDVVATDHAPHPAARKTLSLTDAAFGFTALETALAMTAEVFEDANKRVDWASVARVLAHRPAAIGGIKAEAGRPIRVGEPATLTIVRYGENFTIDGARHVSRSANTPFQGRQTRYMIEKTLIDGAVTYSRD
ncbi:dihydroorotase [Microbacterium gubbeenense]|uniref:dihydroorotase n=1 Tax=Microbacterium gubbeenense TaxID=159896 RepID=UPI00041D26A6|nr:dihydroorotase [Microbacterium gubbeenense]